jgi:hypothetical protein
MEDESGEWCLDIGTCTRPYARGLVSRNRTLQAGANPEVVPSADQILPDSAGDANQRMKGVDKVIYILQNLRFSMPPNTVKRERMRRLDGLALMVRIRSRP